VRNVIVISSSGIPGIPRSHAAWSHATRSTLNFREVTGEVLDQVLEEQVTVVLYGGVVGEHRMGDKMTGADDLEGSGLRDIML